MKKIKGNDVLKIIFRRIIMYILIEIFIIVGFINFSSKTSLFFIFPTLFIFGGICSYISIQVVDYLFIRRLNKKKSIKFGEQLCDVCEGFSCLFKLDFLYYNLVECSKCNGKGKTDWVDNVLGSQR